MNCVSDHAQIILGACCECKAEYCVSCVVPHPSSNEVKLCRECGVILLRQCLRRSLLVACGGILLGTGLTSFWHWSLRASLGLTLTTGYVSWSFFWGWHCGALTWQSMYERLRHWLRIEALALSFLLVIRICAAIMLGICGGAGLQTWRTIRKLRQR
ncbi:MAG: hypothetical protein AAB354_00300 [candidate division KSB1 bacterium]